MRKPIIKVRLLLHYEDFIKACQNPFLNALLPLNTTSQLPYSTFFPKQWITASTTRNSRACVDLEASKNYIRDFFVDENPIGTKASEIRIRKRSFIRVTSFVKVLRIKLVETCRT